MAGCELTGIVVHGDGRGQELGFPTANLIVDAGEDLPPEGVYAVEVLVAGMRRDGLLSIGTRPTFGGRNCAVEVYILDFDVDIYDNRMSVRVIGRLRGQKRFDTVEELKSQMVEDRASARAMLIKARKRME